MNVRTGWWVNGKMSREHGYLVGISTFLRECVCVSFKVVFVYSTPSLSLSFKPMFVWRNQTSLSLFSSLSLSLSLSFIYSLSLSVSVSFSLCFCLFPSLSLSETITPCLYTHTRHFMLSFSSSGLVKAGIYIEWSLEIEYI